MAAALASVNFFLNATPSTSGLLPAGNYIIKAFSVWIQAFTVTGAGTATFIFQVRSGTGTVLMTVPYVANVAGAATLALNIPLSTPTIDTVIPRGDTVICGVLAGATLFNSISGAATIYGSSVA